VTDDDREWNEATIESLYKNGAPVDALIHSTAALRDWWTKLGQTGLEPLAKGRLA
jgi:hypothetical protein